MRRILVLRGGALGDFIVTLPALLALRRTWPDAEIELIGNATAAELAQRRALLNRVYSQHEGRWRELYELRTSDCGVRIEEEPEPRQQPRSIGKAPARWLKYPSPLGPAQSAIRNPQSAIERSSLRSWLSTFDLVVNYWPDPDGRLGRNFPVRAGQRFVSAPAMPTHAPAAAHYVAALRELGVVAESSWCRIEPEGIHWGGNGASPAPAVATGSPAPIAIHPGSGSLKKNWPLDRWQQVVAAVDAPVLLVLGEVELERWGGRPAWSSDSHVRVLANASLEQLVSEFRGCRLFLGHDSGVSHLAAACGTPSVLLFGPTAPAVWAPPAPHVTVLRHGDALDAIAADEVLAVARRTLSKGA